MKKKLIFGFVFGFLCVSTTFAQNKNKIKIRIGVKGKDVYIYHTKPLSAGEGFNIYRKDQGKSKFKKLNVQPVTGIKYTSELRGYLGDKYNEIAKYLNVHNPIALYLKLKTNDFAAGLYTFLYPDIAKVLGRLYIDSTAKIGTSVTYKIEFVNSSGLPTGEPISKKILLKHITIPVPSNISITNKGNNIKLNWTYPFPSKKLPDNVIRFNVYGYYGNRATAHKLNDLIILRDYKKRKFSFDYTTNGIQNNLKFFVTAISMMGDESKPSETTSYNMIDNVPPSQVTNVKASYSNKKVIVTWNINPELDVKGYNVFRTLSSEAHYKKINRRLIGALIPVYEDSLINEGNLYKYKITAEDSSGNISKKSIYAYVRIPYTEKPAEPTDFKAVLNKNNTVSLKWNYKGSKNVLKSFIVLKRAVQENGIPFSRINKLSFLSKTLIDSGVAGSGFKEGWTYIYALFAQGKSDILSDTLFAKIIVPDTTPPNPPRYIYAMNKDGYRVNLSWSHSNSRDISYYLINKKELNRKSFRMTKKLDKSITNYKDDSVKLGRKYIYTITAVDTTGNISKPSKADTVLLRDFDPPAQIRNVRGKISSGKVTLTWEPGFDNDLAGYKVFYSNISTGIYKPLESKIIKKTNLSFTNKNSKSWYIVKAVDTSGNESRGSIPVKPVAAKSAKKK